MVDINQFIALVRAAVPRFAVHPPNQSQLRCVVHDPTVPLMIAGCLEEIAQHWRKPLLRCLSLRR